MSDAYRSPQQKPVFPDRCEVRLRELPEASRAWLLEAARAERDPRRGTVDVGSTPILAIAAGLIPVALASAMVEGLDLRTLSFSRVPPWSGSERWLVALASAAAAGLLVWGIAALRSARRSLLGSFWYAHTAYLLSCEDDKVTAFPLAKLRAHEVLGTNVELSFGSVDVRVPFDSGGEAHRFADYVVRDAAAAKELAGEDTLDAIPGADLIPAKLLARDGSAPGGRPIAVPLAAAAIAVIAARCALPAAHVARTEGRLAVACRADLRDCETYLDRYPEGARRDEIDRLLVEHCKQSARACDAHLARFPRSPRRAEVAEQLFELCRQHASNCLVYVRALPDSPWAAEADDLLFRGATTPAAVAAYRDALPQGRHAHEIGEEMASRYGRAITHYRMTASASTHPAAGTGIEALVRSLQAVSQVPSDPILVRVTDATDRKDKGLPHAGVDRDADVVQAVEQAITLAVGDGVVKVRRLEGGAPVPSVATVVIDVRYVASRGSRRYTRRGSAVSYQAVNFDWTVSFQWPMHHPGEGLVLSLQTDPGDDPRGFGLPSGSETPGQILEREARAQLLPTLVRAFGSSRRPGDVNRW